MIITTLLKKRKEKKEITAHCREIIYTLAGKLGERTIRLYSNLTSARDFIHTTFTEQGSTPYLEEYHADGKAVHNVIAEIEGTEFPEKIILIGAHYDTIEGTPGADDNASAVAGLLELHRLMSAKPAKRTVRFVAFTLEEPPYFSTDEMGSMVHAKNARERNDGIELMVCLEMLGFAGKKVQQKFPVADMKRDYPRQGNYLAVVSLPSSADLAYLWKRVYNSHAKKNREIYDMIGPSSIPGIGFSDHMSFNRFNYRNIMLTDTAFFRNDNYHTENDTFSTINFDFLYENVLFSYHTINEIANMERLPYAE
ncbi:MAG TPA: M28 family peptidase [Spirochaetota bacterium]|nr:M28 family peptidase [Spirochaetota bacterium]HPJ39669.1 M28 family peptidase [Spirochaetota bacterium]HPQ55066.1 M28 family peptidase [Spirochaetota bacterium]